MVALWAIPVVILIGGGVAIAALLRSVAADLRSVDVLADEIRDHLPATRRQ